MIVRPISECRVDMEGVVERTASGRRGHNRNETEQSPRIQVMGTVAQEDATHHKPNRRVIRSNISLHGIKGFSQYHTSHRGFMLCSYWRFLRTGGPAPELILLGQARAPDKRNSPR